MNFSHARLNSGRTRGIWYSLHFILVLTFSRTNTMVFHTTDIATSRVAATTIDGNSRGVATGPVHQHGQCDGFYHFACYCVGHRVDRAFGECHEPTETDVKQFSPSKNKKNIPKIQTLSGIIIFFKSTRRMMAIGNMQVRYAV